MRKYQRTSLFLLLILVAISVLEISCVNNTTPASDAPKTQPNEWSTPKPWLLEWFFFPLNQAAERVTKKIFWLKVSPKNSPISPEKFTGYHTWTDFETFPTEKNTEVSVRAICDGPILLKKWATGYGGVVAQRCQLDKKTVTVVYGHLKLASISASINAELQTGDIIGILGKWYSSETDGERKHLHLSIHEWSTINIRGYVTTSEGLKEWKDPMKYLK